MQSLPPSGLVPWEKETLDAVVEECKLLLDYRTRRDVERRARAGTGTEDKANISCRGQSAGHCHSSEVYKFQKDDQDDIGAVLDKWATEAYIKEVAPETCEKAYSVFVRVVSRGLKEGAQLSEQEAKLLRQDTLKEALIRQIVSRVCEETRLGHVLDGKEGGFMANPSGYNEGRLDSLKSETVEALMTTGFATQPLYVGETMRKQVLQDLEWLDFDGRMTDMSGVSGGTEQFRTDHMCWLSPTDIDRERQSGLTYLMQQMMALPFELNKKANLFLHGACTFQIAMYPATKSHYRKHFDSGYGEKSDNGRKITAIYYPNPPNWVPDHGGSIRMYPRQTKAEQEKKREANVDTHVADIKPGPDLLLLFRARDVPHEVLPCHRKRFAVTLWMVGPAGPGDA